MVIIILCDTGGNLIDISNSWRPQHGHAEPYVIWYALKMQLFIRSSHLSRAKVCFEVNSFALWTILQWNIWVRKSSLMLMLCNSKWKFMMYRLGLSWQTFSIFYLWGKMWILALSWLISLPDLRDFRHLYDDYVLVWCLNSNHLL